jgi:hypothetical protein
MNYFCFISLLIFNANLFAQEVATHYQTEKFDAAIFPASTKDVLPGAQRFTPSKDDVDRAEEALIQQLPELNNDHQNQDDTPVIEKNLKKYRRQYFGYIDQNGKKILFINAFWKKDKEYGNWLSQTVNVEGEGSYFWTVKLNLATEELFDLTVNHWK